MQLGCQSGSPALPRGDLYPHKDPQVAQAEAHSFQAPGLRVMPRSKLRGLAGLVQVDQWVAYNYETFRQIVCGLCPRLVPRLTNIRGWRVVLAHCFTEGNTEAPRREALLGSGPGPEPETLGSQPPKGCCHDSHRKTIAALCWPPKLTPAGRALWASSHVPAVGGVREPWGRSPEPNPRKGHRQVGDAGQTAWRQTPVSVLLPPASCAAGGRFLDPSEPHKTAGDVPVPVWEGSCEE